MVGRASEFPDGDTAREWFESKIWPDGPHLSALRIDQRPVGHQAQDDDAPLPRM